jgi:cobalt-zinc-cadmium resistance protein CzcA
VLERILQVVDRASQARRAAHHHRGGGRRLLDVGCRSMPCRTSPTTKSRSTRSLPELSPTEVEKQVTFVVETALAGIPGLEYTRSLSRNGFSQVTAVFRDDVDIYFARTQVNERLGEAREGLPSRTPSRAWARSRPGSARSTCGRSSSSIPAARARSRIRESRAGNRRLVSHPRGRVAAHRRRTSFLPANGAGLGHSPQLRGVEGVAGVDAIGGYVKQYHVEPDPMQLVSYGLTFADVIDALEGNNVSTGAGYVEHQGESYLVRAAGRIEDAAQIADIVVGSRGGTPIYVRDVATVHVGRELRTGSASENGEEVVVGTVLMLIGANSRTVAQAVDARMTVINDARCRRTSKRARC